jgi:hypothetical protein
MKYSYYFCHFYTLEQLDHLFVLHELYVPFFHNYIFLICTVLLRQSHFVSYNPHMMNWFCRVPIWKFAIDIATQNFCRVNVC